MSQLADYLKRPVRLQDKEVLLVPDLVGPVPISEQHQYVETAGATNTCPAISVRESDIEDMRERYPDYPVYGLWQVLILSGVVSFKRTLQVVPITAEDGFYLHCDPGRAEYSGIYESGFFAADAGFSLEEALYVEADLDQLVLPQQEAKLASELQFERQRAMRRAWSLLSVAVVIVLTLSFATDFVLDRFYHNANRTLQSKTAVLEDLQSGLAKLQTTRLTEVPNNENQIERLASLWATYPHLKTTTEQSFKNKQMTFEVEGVTENPAKKFPWLETQYDPKGIWTLSFKVKGA